MKKVSAIKFSLEQAASHWDVNPRTLSKRFKIHDIAPDSKGLFSVAQINSVVFGDIYQADLRKLTCEADILERKRAEMDRTLLPSSWVELTWEFMLGAWRTIITNHPEMPQVMRDELMREMRSVRVEEYLTNAVRNVAQDSEEGDAAAGTSEAA